MYFDKKFAQQLISCISSKADKTIYIVVSNKLSETQHNLVRIDFKSNTSDKNAPEFSVLEGIL